MVVRSPVDGYDVIIRTPPSQGSGYSSPVSAMVPGQQVPSQEAAMAALVTKHSVRQGDFISIAVTSWTAANFLGVVVVAHPSGRTRNYYVTLEHTGDRTRMTATCKESIDENGSVSYATIYYTGPNQLYYGDAYGSLSVERTGVVVSQLCADFIYRDHLAYLDRFEYEDQPYKYHKSWPDQRNYNPILDFARNVQVFDRSSTWWDFTPTGRYLLRDDVESSVVTNYTIIGTSATAIVDGTSGHSGYRSYQLGTRAAGATAGDTAGLSKTLTLPADLAGFKFGMYFRANAANFRSAWIMYTIYSQALARTVRCGIRYHKQQATVAQNALQYWGPAASWVTGISTYAVPIDNTLWTYLGLQMDWKAGILNTPQVKYLRIGDMSWSPLTTTLCELIASSAAASYSTVDFVVETDTNATMTARIDDLFVADLTPPFA